MTKALDNATKAKLKQYADAKKARDTLMGLDQTTGLVGFDFIQEQVDAGPLFDCHVEDNGWIDFLDRDGFDYAEVMGNNGYLRRARIARVCVRREKPLQYDWAALTRCPEWIPQEFLKRQPESCRRVCHWKYLGPSRGTEKETRVVVKLPLLLAWFQFLWPKEQEWARRAEKYWTAYTENWTRRFPGVGQTVRFEGDVINGLSGLVSGPQTISKLGTDGFWIATSGIEDAPGQCWIDTHNTKWTVV